MSGYLASLKVQHLKNRLVFVKLACLNSRTRSKHVVLRPAESGC